MIVKYCFVRCLSTKNAYFNSTNFEKVSYCCFLPIPEPLCSPRWEWAIMSSTPTLPGQPIVPFSMSNTSWSRITLSLICTDLLKDRRRLQSQLRSTSTLFQCFRLTDWRWPADTRQGRVEIYVLVHRYCRHGPDFHVFCRSSKCSNANSLMFDSEDFSFDCEHRRKPVSVFNSVLDYFFVCEYRYWYLYSISNIFEYSFDYSSAEKREDSKLI